MNANGCCLKIGPSCLVMNAMNGTLDRSEGFAIDGSSRPRWESVSDRWKETRRLAFPWVDVLALAPGTVVESMRDFQDEPPAAAPSDLKISEIAGNQVLLRLGDGRYAT